MHAESDTGIRALLVSLCRRDSPSAPAFTATAQLNDDSYRSAFMEAARELRVPGLALVRLERTGALETLSAAPASELRALLKQLRIRAAEFELERGRVVTLLERNGVSPIVLKGAGLRGVLYSEPVERHVADLDLLVPPTDVDRAIDVMRLARYTAPSESTAAAYRRDHFHLRFLHPLKYVVEIHWALDEPNRPFHLDVEWFRRETIRLEKPGQSAVRLPRHELGLLHLVLQNVQERFLWFNRLVDIDRFVAGTSLDWDFLEQRAIAAGLEVPLALTFELTRQLLGTELPATTLARLRPSWPVRAHLALLDLDELIVTPTRPRRSAADRLLDIWLTPTSRSKISAAGALLTADGLVNPRHVAMGRLEKPGRLERVRALTKVLGYQLALYGRAAAQTVRRRESRRMRRWVQDTHKKAP